MTLLKQWLSSFTAAWEMLIDQPLPQFVRKFAGSKQPTPVQTAAGFTLCGFLLGLLLALLCGFFNTSWLNTYVAAGLFALLAVFISEYKDSFRGFRLLVSAIRLKLDGYGWIDSALGASSGDNSLEKSSGSLTAMILVLAELLSFALLAFHRASFWCAAVFAGAFTIQMLFATLPRKLGASPYLQIPAAGRKAIWFVPALVGIIMLFVFPAAAIVAAAVVGGLGSLLYKNFLLTATPVTSDLITLSGKLTELILLLTALLFIL